MQTKHCIEQSVQWRGWSLWGALSVEQLDRETSRSTDDGWQGSFVLVAGVKKTNKI